MVLGKIEEFEEDGFSVQFFLLKREWNAVADARAKEGAVSGFSLLISLYTFELNVFQLETDIPDTYMETTMIGG